MEALEREEGRRADLARVVAERLDQSIEGDVVAARENGQGLDRDQADISMTRLEREAQRREGSVALEAAKASEGP